ncbi:TetR/AcrR family transcriptional regulator [Spirillospora sp. CA-255316]
MATENVGIPAPDADPVRVHEAATRLFAGLGYDGTTTDMIAEAAGVPREAVLEAGGCSGLYRRALERSSREQCAMLDEVAAGLAAGDDRLGIVLGRILDYHLDRRDVLAIWRHRRMLDAPDMADIEERYQQPIHQRLLAIVGPDVAQSEEFQLISVVFGWCLVGFATGGATRPDGTLLDPDDPHARTQFRSYMAELLARLRAPVT